ncbi:SusC/RagA family TonB-linked outer membrane protein [Chitinophaga barathri]|nr:SusC/RagA family TonB-linked outer membrane protein [Chitinophaga barathri]
MKLSFFLILVASLQLSAETYGQRVRLKYDGADLATVLRDIQRATGFNLAGKYNLVKTARPVTISRDSVDLAEALRLLEVGQDLRLSLMGRSILINERFAIATAEPPNIVDDTSRRSGFPITGLIIGEGDVPLSDVTVQNLTTGKGTYTKASGVFILQNVNLGDRVRVSYVGYADQLFTVGSNREVNLRLKVETVGLNAVQKEGYQITSKRYSNANVTTVKGTVIERYPVANIATALQGRVPGLTVTPTSGYKSGPFRFVIRGESTINGPSDPLIVIDGVPLNPLTIVTDANVVSEYSGFNQSGITGPSGGQSPLYSLSPSDIESIEVLKDGEATAIWGSRGGKGVIMVTTKRGKPGKTRFDITASSGVNFVPRNYPMLDTKTYFEMRREAFANDGIAPDESNAYDLKLWDSTRYTDWQRYFWNGTSNLTQADVSVSGGDKLTTFRVSGSFVNFQALNTLAGSDQKITNQIAIEHKSLNRKLSLSFVNYFSFMKSDMISMVGSVVLPPNAPEVFDEENRLNYKGWYPISDRYPFGSIWQPYTAKTTYINSQLSASYKILQPLLFKIDFGYSQNFQNQIMIFPIASKNPLDNPTGSSIIGQANSGRIIIEPQLEFRKFFLNGDFRAQVGATYQTVAQNGSNSRGDGFVNDNLIRSIENAPIQYGSNVGGEYKYAAAFGRISYIWKSKLTANLTGRRDGSSRFAAGRNIGNFYSAGLGYIISEDNYFKRSLPFVNFAKIRGSYGVTGSDRIADYKYLTRWQSLPSAATYLSSVTYRSVQHANPYLEWQTDKMIDFGIQLGILDDRIGIEASWYQRRSGNQLLEFALPSATGFQSVTANFPATVQNRGIELSVSFNPIRKSNIDLKIYANAFSNKNILLKYPGIEESPYASIFEVGQPIKITRVLKLTGVDPQTGNYTFEDRNKDGRIDYNAFSADNDLISKDLSIRSDGGVGIDFRYRKFEISIFFQFRIADGQNALYRGLVPGEAANIPKEVYDSRWQKPGDIAKSARLRVIQQESDVAFQISDGVITNANFVRLNNLEFRYNLPEGASKKLGMTSCNVFIRGNNLLLITGYKGSDPELQSFGSLPIMSALTAGAKLSF